MSLIDLLTKSGHANVNLNNKIYGTPLECAARQVRKESLDIVKLLLSQGADPTIGSLKYTSPLHATARMRKWSEGESNRDEIEQRYLAVAGHILDCHPSTINLKGSNVGTPLQAAVAARNIRIVELLLDRSLDYSIYAGKFGTPIHAAAFSGSREILDLILFKSEGRLTVKTVDNGGWLALHLTAVKNRAYLIDTLTTAETSLLTRDLGRRHSLHFAAGCGSVEFAEQILDRHKDAIQDTDADGWTPLHWVCREDCIDMISLLVDRGADKNAKTTCGWRPIHVAMYHRAAFEDPDKVIELVKPDSQDSEEICQSTLRDDPVNNDEVEKFPVKAGSVALVPSSKHSDTYTCDSCYCVSALLRLFSTDTDLHLLGNLRATLPLYR